jgi:ATP-binding cassette subfamily F protein 3
MIHIENLSYAFPQKDLFDNINFSLVHGQHCAFIGTSGSGKSTLIKIIMNPEPYMYTGKLTIEPTCRIGYVSQFSHLDRSNHLTVFEYIAQEFITQQNHITDLCKQMETAQEIEPLLEQYQKAYDAFESIDGDNYESNILKKLNLADMHRLVDLNIRLLSGGEFKLIQVIREMLTRPDLIIMDEPDVFLDFEHMNSLKNLINSHKGIMLIITHNRYLLNHCFNKIIHLENKELQEFDGPYIDYNFSLLQKKIELQELAIADTEEIERNKNIIDRLRDISSNNSEASRGRSLNARVKIQERLLARRIKEPFVDIKQPNIDLLTPYMIEEFSAIHLENYSLAFDEPLLENVNFQIGSKEKVALIGPNGTGKTTLIRQIFQNSHDAIKVDSSIKLAYLSQLQGETLNESNTVLDEFFDLGFETRTEIHNYITHYGFDESILTQSISSLSGGEKNILQLAKISSSDANFLLLDEPTSHLDTYSQLALEKALQNYNGGFLMISHDFYTVVNSVDYVLFIEDKKIRKMSMRKFRKRIYARHFDVDYLELEKKKKELETRIEVALNERDFEKSAHISEKLEEVINKITP